MPLDRQFRLAARPVGMPKPSDRTFTEEPGPEPADGTLVVKVLYVSLDPAMRGWMNDAKSYIAPVALGAVMRAGGVGAVGTMVGQIAKIRGCRAIGIVGGDILDAALTRLAMHARVVICGANSQYNSTTGIRGPANYLSLPVNRASMTGTLVFDYADRYAEAARELGA